MLLKCSFILVPSDLFVRICSSKTLFFLFPLSIPQVMLLKCSVGLIVAEGLIAQFLISSGKTPYSDDDGDDHFNEDQKTKRGYCALVLIEICILSLPYLFAFGIKKIRPSEKSLRLSQDASSSSSAALEGAGGAEAGAGGEGAGAGAGTGGWSGGVVGEGVSFCAFLSQYVQLWDVVGTHFAKTSEAGGLVDDKANNL
ncbi:hypothetical protein B484DRAFT_182971 [Ochromonadaceae sp. CCMP2298]|nr:hypothetical protein B484DRAFT_182971 [Ochromonadaceae sp. CCMP2298]